MRYKLNEKGIEQLKNIAYSIKDALAERVHDRAVELCPVDTGALRQSGRCINRKTVSHIIFGESNAMAKKRGAGEGYDMRPRLKGDGTWRGPEFYALWVEIGSQGRRGQFFMTRALIQELSKPLPKEFGFPAADHQVSYSATAGDYTGIDLGGD